MYAKFKSTKQFSNVIKPDLTYSLRLKKIVPHTQQFYSHYMYYLHTVPSSWGSGWRTWHSDRALNMTSTWKRKRFKGQLDWPWHSPTTSQTQTYQYYAKEFMSVRVFAFLILISVYIFFILLLHFVLSFSREVGGRWRWIWINYRK